MMSIINSVVVLLYCALLFSGCSMAYKHLDRHALAEEKIAIENTTEEMRVWQTSDLAIHYHMHDDGGFITLTGFVKIMDSVTYTFPRAKFLNIYVYQLNREGISTSKHLIRPRLSRLNTFPERSGFKGIIAKDKDTVSLAFGYWGNFVDNGNSKGGGELRGGGDEWEIFHSPFD